MSFSPPPDLESTHWVQRRGPVTLVVHRDWLAHLPVEEILAGAALQHWGRPLANHGLVGRAELVVLETSAGQLVAKELSRGGLLGRWLPGLSFDPWRPAREAALVEQLSVLAVPTATVAVARSTRVMGGLYRCELASVRLLGAVDLLAAWRGAAVSRRSELARDAGLTLGRLHHIGLVHRDLQVKNLLVPAEGGERAAGLLTVIDLDGCRIRRDMGRQECLVALTRFARSLVKNDVLPRSGGGLPVAALRSFLSAYAGSQEDLTGQRRAEWMRQISRRLARQLPFHRPFWP